MTIINFMNTYDMVLYWKSKYLVMEKEVRKAQKGIARLKRRERYLKDNTNMKYIIPVHGEAKPTKDLISNFPKFGKVKTIVIDRIMIKTCPDSPDKVYIHCGIKVSGRREYYNNIWFSKVRWLNCL